MAKKTIKANDGVEVACGETVWLARDGIPTRKVEERANGTLWVPARGTRENIPFFSTRGGAIAARLHELRTNLTAIQAEIRRLEAEAEAER